MTDTPTAAIAEYIVAARWDDLSPELRHEAKRALLNHFAAAFAGSRDPTIDMLVGMLGGLVSPGPDAGSSLIGRPQRLAPLDAALANAAMSNVLDFCDTHLPTVIHPTAPIAPALFALAEMRTATKRLIHGRHLVHAFALGVDVACRIGNAISPGHYARGWHITSTCGVIGAAVAAGKLVGLDERRMVHAIGAAATQACGLVETLGFDAKSLSVGNAARNGLLAALLAERGFTGPALPLEGQRGFLAVMSDAAAPEALAARIIDGLGQRSELSANTYKPYPCGVVLHPVIDACLELHQRQDFRAGDATRVVVRGHPLLAQRADRQVSTGREAQVCLDHTVAVALSLGRAGPAEYTDACVASPPIQALSRLVVCEQDAGIAVDAAVVTATLGGGRTETVTIEHARGSLARPLTDTEIEAKLADLAASNLSATGITALTDAVWSLDRLEDASLPIRLAATRA